MTQPQPPSSDNMCAATAEEHCQFSPEQATQSANFMRGSITRIMDAGAQSAACDPQRQQERGDSISSGIKQGAAVSFNTTAFNFLSNMLKIFKGDILILKMIQELRKHMQNKHGLLSGSIKNVEPVNIPALLFAQQSRQVLHVPVRVDERTGDTVCVDKSIHDLIMEKNEYLTVGEYDMQLLNALDFKTKYAKLNATNKEYVWKTLNKLLIASAAVIVIENDGLGAVDELVTKVVHKSKKISQASGGRMTLQQASQLIASDKDIKDASKRVMQGARRGDTVLERAAATRASSQTSSSSTNTCGTQATSRTPDHVQSLATPASSDEHVPAVATACDDDTASEAVLGDVMNAHDFKQYIKEMTGKTVDVSGFADKDGLIHMDDEGLNKMMGAMATQGSSCMNKDTARSNAIRDRLRTKLEQRRADSASSTSHATATDTAVCDGSNRIDDETMLAVACSSMVDQAMPGIIDKVVTVVEDDIEHPSLHPKPATSASHKHKPQKKNETAAAHNRRVRREVNDIMKQFQ